MPIDPQSASDVLHVCDAEGDFHALPSDRVTQLLAYADLYRYRKPANANGSRGRYFHAYLQRLARRAAQ